MSIPSSSQKSAPSFQHVYVVNSTDTTLCQCCLVSTDLRSIIKPYLYHGKNEVYSEMLTACFSSEFSPRGGMICSHCVRRLRATMSFRECIQRAKSYLDSMQNLVISDVKPASVEVNVVQLTPTSETKPAGPVTRTTKSSNAKPVKVEDEDILTLDDSSDTDMKDFPLMADEESEKSPDPKPAGSNAPAPQNSQSSSEDDDFFDDCLNPSNTKTPKTVFNRMEFDVGEQKTLPYALDNTDRICEICNKEFSFFSDLLKHMPEHYPNHICDICGKICATRKSLMFHTKTHTDIRQDCKMCDKSFKNKSSLNAHVKVQHKGEKIFFKCNICGDLLNTYNNRIKHLAEKHGKEEKAYKCMQCPCKYKLGSHLRAHIRRVHLQEKNHKCSECGVSFFTRKCLEKHTLKHSGDRNISCNVCGKSCGTKQTLKLHLKTHETKQDNYMANIVPASLVEQPMQYTQEDHTYPIKNYMNALKLKPSSSQFPKIELGSVMDSQTRDLYLL